MLGKNDAALPSDRFDGAILGFGVLRWLRLFGHVRGIGITQIRACLSQRREGRFFNDGAHGNMHPECGAERECQSVRKERMPAKGSEISVDGGRAIKLQHVLNGLHNGVFLWSFCRTMLVVAGILWQRQARAVNFAGGGARKLIHHDDCVGAGGAWQGIGHSGLYCRHAIVLSVGEHHITNDCRGFRRGVHPHRRRCHARCCCQRGLYLTAFDT